MRRRIIFVGGIHGVGKTTLCKSLCTEFNIKHYSASELISEVRQINFHTNKQTDNIETNQDALITAINEFLDFNTYYLLDGHFCLLTQDEKVSRIPVSLFSAISPMSIILLHDDPKKINTRLMGRDREKYNIDLLVSLQEEETIYSEYIANHLNIPYLKASPFTDKEAIYNFVDGILEKGSVS